MGESNRQQDYENFVAACLEDPQLKRALEIFQIGQEQYITALSQFEIVSVSLTNSTCLEGKHQCLAGMK